MPSDESNNRRNRLNATLPQWGDIRSGGIEMEERNCKDCVFNSYAHGGCCSWDCEFISRREAVEAYREKMGQKEKE